jgi:hypothetical protein
LCERASHPYWHSEGSVVLLDPTVPVLAVPGVIHLGRSYDMQESCV